MDSVLSSLFPAGAVVCCLSEPYRADNLLPSEAMQVARASQKRVQDFRAGRHCARRALVRLGFFNHALTIKEDRTPNWPAGVVGSITHTEGFAAAVVAPDTICLSVGLDAETAGRVEPELWPQICSAQEIIRLGTMTDIDASLLASLIFSAKEAFFKCQFHLTGNLLSFTEVTVDFGGIGGASGSCSIKCDINSDFSVKTMSGVWVIDQTHVIAGFHVPAC